MRKKVLEPDEKLFELIIESIKEKKGKDIVSINLRGIENSLFDVFVICHGDSKTQVSAIADAIELKTRLKLNLRPLHLEGQQNAQWILMDYQGIIVHVFQKDQREFYRLEDLWADGVFSLHKDE
jgi:ribosome-associated protein